MKKDLLAQGMQINQVEVAKLPAQGAKVYDAEDDGDGSALRSLKERLSSSQAFKG